MPEFCLDLGDAHKAFNALDAFTQGYVTAMFFTETGDPDDAESDLENADVGELAAETWDRIKADCARFQDDARIVACIDGRDQEAGRDFWYTRNGHGCGFWDGDWPEPDSDYLEGQARRFGNVDLYRGDDGQLYLM